jgi:hypothetical protein
MKKIIKLTESQLENLVKHVVNESKKEENFIQKAVEKQEKKEQLVNLVLGVREMV